MFVEKTPAEFEAMSEYQKERYLDEKKKHEVAEQAKAIEKQVDEQVEAKVAEKIEAKITEVKADYESKIQVVKDEAQKEVELVKTFMNRAKQNEINGKTFDVALDEAMKEHADELAKLATDKNAKVTIQLKDVGVMGLSSITDLSSANVEMAPGIRNLPNRRIHMRDILNTGRMTTSDFHYLREVGGEGDVGVWAENSGNKPALDLDYIEKNAPSQFIAGYLNISRKSLDDIPAMRSSLAARLLEKYLIAEDFQILQGNGTSPQLEGILEVAEDYDGVKVRLIERVIDAIGQLEENEFYADGIILKPRDWSEIATTVSNGSENVFTLPGLGIVAMNNGVLTINGVPVYKMNGMPSAPRQFLIGDWLMGAQLLIREQPKVEFSYENGENFIKNQITVRVEGRVALPIFYEEAFVKGETGTDFPT